MLRQAVGEGQFYSAEFGDLDKEIQDSFLGKFCQKKKGVFYKEANFFSVKEVTDLLNDVGFSRFFYYQTLYKLPSKMNSIQRPQKGFGQGGFVVISGEKKYHGYN